MDTINLILILGKGIQKVKVVPAELSYTIRYYDMIILICLISKIDDCTLHPKQCFIICT